MGIAQKPLQPLFGKHVLNSLTSVLGFLSIMIGHKYKTLSCSVIGGKLAVQWTKQGMWNGNGNLFIRFGSHDENDAKATSSYGPHKQAIEYIHPQAVHFGNGTFQNQVFPIVLLGDIFSLLHG